MPGPGLKPRPPTPEGPFLVVGLARSGAAVARLLAERGESVIGVDAARPSGADRLAASGVEVHLDEAGIELLDRVSTVVKSPGVPQEAPVIVAARSRGLPVLGELEVAWRLLPNRFIGVTGTNGKTTVTELLGHIYRAAGEPVAVTGNVGSPVSELVGAVDPTATVVCECSSFQLEDTDAFAPECGLFLNIAEDHLDRHRSIEAYLAAKLRLFENQVAGDIAILSDDGAYAAADWDLDDGAVFHEVGWEPADGAGANVAPEQAEWGHGSTLITYCSSARGDAGSGESPVGHGADGGSTGYAPMSEPAGGIRDFCDVTYTEGALVWRGEPIVDAAELRLFGRHNVDNAMAAATAALAMGVDIDGVREGLRSFPGVPHRLEQVAEIDGVTYINDSKATNPAAAAAAIRSFDSPVRVILGGSLKGGDFRELVEPIAERSASCYLIGDAAEQIERDLRRGDPQKRELGPADPQAGDLREGDGPEAQEGGTSMDRVAITRESDLERAFQAAAAAAISGDVILLAPACASFDAYRDFEQRGDHFRALVEARRSDSG